MNALRLVISSLIGLFVDDRFLAAGIIIVVAGAWLIQTSGVGSPLLPGAVLCLGCLAVLVLSALSEGKK